MSSTENRSSIRSDWSQYWHQFDGQNIPASIQPFSEFMNMLRPGQKVLEIGCGFGRITRLIAQRGCKVAGIDINDQVLEVARSQNSNAIEYHLMSGDNMSRFQDNSFDSVVLFGTFGGVQKELRDAIMREAVRVLNAGGMIYVAEFARKHGDTARAARYTHDAAITGEEGTRIVYDQTGEILFIAKHFEEYELQELMQRHGLNDVRVVRHYIEKQGLNGTEVERREQLSVWATK